ncbi:hypothetical protein GCM10023093_28220 [Nemorincola caseinilytica]|uniref:Uncharacterized protein n=2 Tax=Nemorincola caseinilytica TaxID=2054315 RepID=A0ABP8NPY8_9BACT
MCAFAMGAYAQNSARYRDIKRSWRDPELEYSGLVAANKKAASIRCQEHYILAKIVSDDWEVLANEDGNIVARYIHMELYGETRDGRCGVAHCVFRQKRMGDETYSSHLRLVELGEFYNMECE